MKELNKKISKNTFEYTMFIVASICLLSTIPLSQSFNYPDSYGYIDMSLIRGAAYPIFLAIFRLIFGSEHYIIAVIIFQNIFIAYCICSFCLFIYKEYNLKQIYTILIILFCLVCTICPSIFSSSKIFINNSILSEPLMIGLFFLVLKHTITAVIKSSFMPMIKVILLTLVMISLRGQMLSLVPVIFICSLYIAVKKKDRLLKSSLIIVICTILVMGASSFIEKTYHYIVNGVFVDTPFTKLTVLTKAMYISDKDDKFVFQDEYLSDLYSKLRVKIDKEKCSHEYAEGNLFKLFKHYENSYDIILHENIKEVVFESVHESGTSDSNQMMLKADDIAMEMLIPLIKDNFGEFCTLTGINYIIGLIRSNSIWLNSGWIDGNDSAKYNIINILTTTISFVFYLSALILIFILLSKSKESKSALGMIVVLLFILSNTAVVSLSIFSLARYLFYTIAPFYIIFFLMLLEFKNNIKNNSIF